VPTVRSSAAAAATRPSSSPFLTSSRKGRRSWITRRSRILWLTPFWTGNTDPGPSRSRLTVRYYGLYANAHRGKVKKAGQAAVPLLVMEEELRPFPSKGWAEMIRKLYEVDPMVCPQCGGTMKFILTRANSLIDHPHRWDETKSVPLTFIHTAQQKRHFLLFRR
jgi:hypothetical protein